MTMSTRLFIRLVGMLLLGYAGGWVGTALAGSTITATEQQAIWLLILSGAGLGLIVAPRLTIEPLDTLLQRIRQMSLIDFFFTVGGGFGGLLFAVLWAVPLALLPPPLNQFLPLVVTAACVYVGAAACYQSRETLHNGLRALRHNAHELLDEARHLVGQEATTSNRHFLIDTSAIIDGRILEVVQTGFMDGVLVVPQFVLHELQTLADSSDDLRRAKGRRGLELLKQMQEEPILPVEILDVEASASNRVDDSLVVLARQNDWAIITNDFNLNRVAGLQGVQVLSLNALSDAVRPPVVQDQQLKVLIRNEGNTRQQGVGYLEDGTPVVVEEARSLIGQTVDVVVTRLLQTQSGRLVFAQLDDGSPPVYRGSDSGRSSAQGG